MAEATTKHKRTFSSLAWHLLWPLLILGVLNLLWGDYIGPIAEEQFGDEIIYARNCTYEPDAFYLLVCEGNATLGAGRAVQNSYGENGSPYKDDCVLDTTTGQIHCRVTPGLRGWYNGPLALLNLPSLILAGPVITSFNKAVEYYESDRDPSNVGSLMVAAGVLFIWPLWFLTALRHLFRRK